MTTSSIRPGRLILSFAITLGLLTTLAVAPARAQTNEEVGRAIAGAVTLFILGTALADTLEKSADKNKSGKSKSKSTARAPYAPPVWVPRPMRPAPLVGQADRHKILPAACFFVINDRRERVGVFGQRCLRETLRKADRLPRQCERRIRIAHGRDAIVYRADCLRQFGYRMSSHRR